MKGPLQLLRNVSSNYVKVGVNGLVLLFLTPYVVNELGVAQYAVWVILHTVGYYLRFLDLGVADAQVQRHSVLQARGATTELGRLHGTVLTLFVGAGLLALALSIAAAVLPSADLFDIPPEFRSVYVLVLPLVGLAVLFSFTEGAFNGLFEAYQRYDAMNAIDVVLAVLAAAATFAALHFGYGLIGLAVVAAAADGLGAVVKAVAARRMFPAHAQPRLGFDPDSWRAIRGFSLWNSLNDLVTEGTSNLDKLLIPIWLASTLVAPYSLALTVAAMVFVAAEPVTETFFPIAARRHGRSDTIALGLLLTRGSKLVNVATLPTTVVVICFGGALLDVWIGEDVVKVPSAVLWLTVLSFYLSTYLWTSLSVLMGAGKARTVFWISAGEVLLAVVLLLTFVPPLGLTGFALASFAANLAVGLGFLVPYACRLTRLAYWPFLGRTFLRPIAAVLPALGVGVILLRTVDPVGWVATLGCALATGVLGMGCVYAAATNRWERRRYYVVLRRFLGRSGAGAE
ncbi:MAG: lipopolysaccharide biosynthesis protein [Gammaproteobacteria bacterium]